MPPFSLIYKGGIFLYPIPSTETYRDSDKYLWYDGFRKEAMSYIDEDKNIFVHESCVNLSQEEHSQYIPFEMDRYYHGIDLMEMTLQIYFVNSQMGANISEPINVQYSNNRIRFGWLVDRNATAVSGTLMFEIRAIGTVEYEGAGNGQDLQYVWKSHPNSQITILKSLAGDTTFIPTEDWYDKLVATVNKQTNDALTYKNDAVNSASEADTSQKAALASENKAREYATNSQNSANVSEASAQRSEASAVKAESWAVGGTNTRSGEDSNNAKYWCKTTEDMLDTFRADIATDVANLDAEIARAKTAEEGLSGSINAEEARAKAAESALSGRIDTEITRAEDAERVLTTNLTSEISRATSAESTLQSNINAEKTRAESAENTLTVNLASEISRATDAESALSDRIDVENTRALSAESILTKNLNDTNTALSEESSRAMGVENNLSTRITTVENKVETNITNININATKISGLETTVATKANKAEVDAALDVKLDTSTFNSTVTNINTALDSKANTSSVEVLSESVTALSSSLSNKANIADINEALDLKADVTDVTSALEGKANIDHAHTYIHIGAEEPTDASVVLWIDTVNGLKYYDGSAWVNVPMATS